MTIPQSLPVERAFSGAAIEVTAKATRRPPSPACATPGRSGLGDHSSQLEDPFGHLWWVATHKEDVTPDEMEERTSDVREERSF